MKSVGSILQTLARQDTAAAAELALDQDLQVVRAQVVDKRGACDVSDTVLVFNHPTENPPEAEVCPGLLRALRPFVIAAALGITSAEADGFLVSCPGKRGTTWRVEGQREGETGLP